MSGLSTRMSRTGRVASMHRLGASTAAEPVIFPNVAVEGVRSASTLLVLRAEAEKRIGRPLAPIESVLRVYGHDPVAFHAVYTEGVLSGGFAFLHLTAKGARSLLQGELDFASPDMSALAGRDERPRAIYWWAFYGPGVMSAAMPQMLRRLSSPRFADADMWSVPMTASGERCLKSIGFRAHSEPGYRLFHCPASKHTRKGA